MNIFISGGCKNGKSHFAQEKARALAAESKGGAREKKLYYLATMEPRDTEDEARIARHIRERAGQGFRTIECGRSICSGIEDGATARRDSDGGRESVERDGVFLLDSITALLSNEMFREDGSFDFEAPGRVAGELKRFSALISEAGGSAVFVSDYIYSDSAIYSDSVEKYRRGLALCDRTMAEVCDEVYELSCGFPLRFK